MTNAPLPGGTVTLLVSGIVDWSTLVRALPRHAPAILDDYETLVGEAVERYGGRVVDVTGDSIVAGFGRARDAASAAAEAQRRLFAHGWTEECDVRIRMGLHTGEPVVARERYVGVAVHRAVRLASVAHGWQVLLTSSTRELVADDPPDGVSLRELGEHTLPDFDQPPRLCQLVIDGLPADFPSLVTPGDAEREAALALPGGTVTFLFSDIESSTELTRRLRERWADVLSQHRRILRDALGAEGGREVDTQGDAFFFAFVRARDAIVGAAEAQRRLAAEDWPDGAAVRVRMGVHTGEPNVGDEGYLGLDVVRGARLCSAAHGGQVLISETTRALVGSDEPEGIGLIDLGEQRLKDFEEPQRVYQLVIAGLQTRFDPPAALEIREPTAFTGREVELAAEAEAAVRDFRAGIEEHVAASLRAAGVPMSVRDALEGPSRRVKVKVDHGMSVRAALVTGIVVVAVLAAAAVTIVYLIVSAF